MNGTNSKARGITLDLGFSSFCLSKDVRITLVDCPGHGSLIKTVIGGSSIIDMMLLVIDVTKGIQAQTAECLVIGEIIGSDLIVVLNKTDLVKPEVREKKIATTEKLLNEKVLKNFPNFKSTRIVSCSAANGDIDQVVNAFNNMNLNPDREALENSKFIMSIDHCFQETFNLY